MDKQEKRQNTIDNAAQFLYDKLSFGNEPSFSECQWIAAKIYESGMLVEVVPYCRVCKRKDGHERGCNKQY